MTKRGRVSSFISWDKFYIKDTEGFEYEASIWEVRTFATDSQALFHRCQLCIGSNVTFDIPARFGKIVNIRMSDFPPVQNEQVYAVISDVLDGFGFAKITPLDGNNDGIVCKCSVFWHMRSFLTDDKWLDRVAPGRLIVGDLVYPGKQAKSMTLINIELCAMNDEEEALIAKAKKEESLAKLKQVVKREVEFQQQEVAPPKTWFNSGSWRYKIK